MSSVSDNEAEVDWIGCLTYKSVATAKPSAQDLEILAARARARNRSLGITGMLLFEDGCFLQSLEGPQRSLSALWASIKRDVRHNHIEVLSEHIATARLFSGWDLLLDGRPESVAQTAATAAKAPPAMEVHIERLVELALNADDLRINAMIASFADQGWTSDAILSLLIEPGARALGDAWLDDACSEIDLTIGLSMLQLAGHAVRYSPSPQSIRNSQYRILLATAPGEQHMLGTTLLADQFLEAGWQVEMAFPESDEALTNQMNAQHPDAVDLGLSEALSRSHAIDRLRSTVKMSRQAAGNYPTVISVGGRLFAEAAATASSVGADHARAGLAGTSIRLAELVQKSRKL
jgi:blue light- and temperature-responsive anti-repressor